MTSNRIDQANSRTPEGVHQIRVMIVDDHAVVRRGLADLLAERHEFAVVGEAGSVREAIAEERRVQPDVVIMDLRLPDGTGIEACREIRNERQETKVLILTSHADRNALFSAVMAGAAGYLLKDLDPTRIQDAVRTVGNGGSLLDPQMATEVLERLRNGKAAHPADDAFAALSPQEDRILELIADGLTNAEIAGKLALAEKTIKNYVSQIYAKLSVQRRSQAARLATERRMRKQEG
ncbi:MAG: response regulator transcription factor [Chloroflexi bacterium]|nr:response regulator transcription factor [Chloroflexota bacterium]